MLNDIGRLPVLVLIWPSKSKSVGGQSSFLLLSHHFWQLHKITTNEAEEDEDWWWYRYRCKQCVKSNVFFQHQAVISNYWRRIDEEFRYEDGPRCCWPVKNLGDKEWSSRRLQSGRVMNCRRAGRWSSGGVGKMSETVFQILNCHTGDKVKVQWTYLYLSGRSRLQHFVCLWTGSPITITKIHSKFWQNSIVLLDPGLPGVRSLGQSVFNWVRDLCWLNWCDSGWWRYQLNTNW